MSGSVTGMQQQLQQRASNVRFVYSGLPRSEIQTVAQLTEYIRHQRQEAGRKRAAAEMDQCLPSLDSYMACIRKDPTLLSRSFDVVVLATQRRCEEWHVVRDSLRRTYEDPWLFHYDMPLPWETNAEYQQRVLTVT